MILINSKNDDDDVAIVITKRIMIVLLLSLLFPTLLLLLLGKSDENITKTFTMKATLPVLIMTAICHSLFTNYVKVVPEV